MSVDKLLKYASIKYQSNDVFQISIICCLEGGIIIIMNNIICSNSRLDTSIFDCDRLIDESVCVNVGKYATVSDVSRKQE